MNIAGFAVIPRMFRKGVGTALLRHTLSLFPGCMITVSTARNNIPAISLYAGHDFQVTRNWIIGDDLTMVTMCRNPAPMTKEGHDRA